MKKNNTEMTKAFQLLVGTVSHVFNACRAALIWIASMALWIIMPCGGAIFAGFIVGGMDTSNAFGQWSAIAVYAVYIGAGYKAAWDAGRGLRAIFGGVRW